MIINHNISAMNTYRQLTINNAFGSKSLEKLSSGLRINRAGDDAAGLAISEKMRGQIRGLNMAAKNAQDGISLIQTAEGALNETHSILQRMRELAVQSSSDTNTEADRSEIQKEINELAAEITRISTTTEFNTQKLLDGSFKSKFHIGANEGQNVDLAISAMDANALKVAGSGEGLATFEVKGTPTINETPPPGTGLVNGEQTLDVVELDNVTIGDGTNNVIANYGLANENGDIVAVSKDGKEYVLLKEATKVGDLASAIPNANTDASIAFDERVISGQVVLTATIESGTTTKINDITAVGSVEVEGLEAGTYTVASFDPTVHLTDAPFDESNPVYPSYVLMNADGNVVGVSEDSTQWYAADDSNLVFSVDSSAGWNNVVANATAIMTVTTAFEDGDKLEIKADGGINVSSQEAADKAITIINEAIENVSAERSKLGAMQNRLDHTINNLTTASENLQAAESRIRDVDYAAAA